MTDKPYYAGLPYVFTPQTSSDALQAATDDLVADASTWRLALSRLTGTDPTRWQLALMVVHLVANLPEGPCFDLCEHAERMLWPKGRPEPREPAVRDQVKAEGVATGEEAAQAFARIHHDRPGRAASIEGTGARLGDEGAVLTEAEEAADVDLCRALGLDDLPDWSQPRAAHASESFDPRSIERAVETAIARGEGIPWGAAKPSAAERRAYALLIDYANAQAKLCASLVADAERARDLARQAAEDALRASQTRVDPDAAPTPAGEALPCPPASPLAQGEAVSMLPGPAGERLGLDGPGWLKAAKLSQRIFADNETRQFVQTLSLRVCAELALCLASSDQEERLSPGVGLRRLRETLLRLSQAGRV